MSKKPAFVNGQIYHVYNRGADKRQVFDTDRDRMRFVTGLCYFNNTETVSELTRVMTEHSLGALDFLDSDFIPTDDQRLVDVVAFALMPNHFHLLLCQRQDDGIVKFMHRIGTGYTNYFNLKNDRDGCLFQGRFKAQWVDRDEYLAHIINYIHANPLDLNHDGRDPVKFLDGYRWSSHMDYCGWDNFPQITKRDFMQAFMEDGGDYRRAFSDWVRGRKEDMPAIKHIAIDAAMVLIITFGLLSNFTDLFASCVAG